MNLTLITKSVSLGSLLIIKSGLLNDVLYKRLLVVKSITSTWNCCGIPPSFPAIHEICTEFDEALNALQFLTGSGNSAATIW